MSPARPGANGHVPLDLEAAAKAAATEAEAAPFPFRYKGKTYTVPPATSWPVAALAQLAAGDLEGSLAALLGQGTYAKLVAAGLTVGQLNVLFDQLGKAAGFPSLPNSPLAALPSSAPT